MTMGKRQLVLAALVVALGAAVYLNFALSGNTQLPATEAVTSGRELGGTLLVNASGSALGSTPSGSSAASKSSVKTSTEDYFSEAELSRQKARDNAKEQLNDILNNANANDAAKKDAVSQAANIAENILKENSIENLIKAKGFSNCIVSIQNGECSVVVKPKGTAQDDAIIIKDIISGQSGITYDKIKIIESK